MTVYIVNSTDEFGGAEKRFAGLWLHLRRRGEVDARLVVSDRFWEKLGAAREFAEARSHEEAVVRFPSAGGRNALRRTLLGIWLRDRRAVFHYVFVSPLLLQHFPSRRTLVSITATGWHLLNRTATALMHAGMAVAGHVDVLNEDMQTKIQRALPWKDRAAITLTPNSFVDLAFYRPAPFAEKRPRITFLGLFSREKGVFPLVDALPEIDESLRARGLAVDYRLMGRESETPGIGPTCAHYRSRTPSIDVEAYEEKNPVDVLTTSKAFLSLQQTTNYPSKSLLEALACGNLPIVTDVGESRRIAPDAIGFYVPRAFTSKDIAGQAAKILSMPEAEFEERTQRARAHLERHFSVETMAGYYADIYERLRGTAC